MITSHGGERERRTRTVFGVDGFQYGLEYAVNVHG